MACSRAKRLTPWFTFGALTAPQPYNVAMWAAMF